MINSFSLISPKEIIFGNGKFQILPSIIKRYGTNVLLVVGANSFINSIFWKNLETKLQQEKISYNLVSILSEPSPQGIDEIVDLYRNTSIEVVVGIGGGSVLDAGKAISAMLKCEDSVKNYLEGVGNKEIKGEKIPYIAVPTTAGTGSEATKNAVLSEVGENGFKKSLRHNNFVPDVALLDAELSTSCTPYQTAICAMDALSQLTEAYLSPTSSVLTDIYAIQGISLVLNNIEKVYLNGNELEARNALLLASFLGGICLANAGLGTVHGFAGAIGARLEIPHGLICGALMATCNSFTINNLDENSPAIKKYAELGRIIDKNDKRSNSENAKIFINKLFEITKFLKIPKLSTFGLNEENAKQICEETDNKNNPVKFSKNQLFEILKTSII